MLGEKHAISSNKKMYQALIICDRKLPKFNCSFNCVFLMWIDKIK